MKTKNQLAKYILPNVFAMIGVSFYILADTFFISATEGTNGITALNLTLPLYGLMFALGAMIGIGSATRYSLCKATGNDSADDYFSNAVFWEIIISLIFVVLGIFCPDTVLRIMGADEEILRIGKSYLQIALCFAPCFMLNYTFTAFVRNDGAPRVAMTATLLSSLFNVIFDYVLMFPLGLGMVGAALATAVSPVVSMLICLTHYLSAKNTVKFHPMLPSPKKLFISCNLGVVAFIGEIASGITTMVFNLILLSLVGNIAVAAYGVIANMALVGTAIFNGVAQGLQPLASEAHGKGDLDSEHKILKQSLLTGLVLSVITVATVWINAGACVSIFNSSHSEAMASIAVPGLKIYFAGFLVASINIIRAGFFSATGHAKESSMIAILRGIIAIVVFAFVLSKLFGGTGVWLAFPVTEMFTLIATCWMGKRDN